MLPMTARVPAAADAYHAMTEPRAYRPPPSAEQAASEIAASVDRGRLDRDAAGAVCEAAGQRIDARGAGRPGSPSRRSRSCASSLAAGRRRRSPRGSALRSTLGLTTLVTAFAVLASPVVATGPTDAGGTIQETSVVPTSFRMADGNVFLTIRVAGTMSGTYAGEIVEELELVAHPDGSSNFRGRAICACTIAGVGSGTLVLLFLGTGTAVEGEGSYTILRGTGDLASARGQGTFSAAGGIGTYSGRQHYEP
jgi:hypothetical protein